MNKPLTAKQRYWQEHLVKAQQFDGSVAAYARAQGLTPKKLYQWQHLLNKRTRSSGEAAVFSKVVATEMVSPTDSQHAALRVLIGDLELRFNTLPDPQWLADWQRLQGLIA